MSYFKISGIIIPAKSQKQAIELYKELIAK